MKNNLLVLLISFTVLGLVNCGDKDPERPADSPSVILLTKPTAGTIYINGTPLLVQGTIEDPDGLANVRVEIRKTGTSTVLFQQSQSAGGVTFYNLNRSWTVTGITSNTDAIVKVVATDRYSYEITKEVAVVLTD